LYFITSVTPVWQLLRCAGKAIFCCRSDDYESIVQWKDNKVVYIGSNHISVEAKIMVKRNSQQEVKNLFNSTFWFLSVYPGNGICGYTVIDLLVSIDQWFSTWKAFFAESALLSKWRSLKRENIWHFQRGGRKSIKMFLKNFWGRTKGNYHTNQNWDDNNAVEWKRALAL